MRRPFLLSALLLLLAVVVAGCSSADGSRPAAASGDAATKTVPANGAEAPLPARHPQLVAPEAGVAIGAKGVDASGTPQYDLVAKPPTDAEIRRELAAANIPAGARAALRPDGTAIAPLEAPELIREVIDAGNRIARAPYVYGGGHRTFVDTAYDCSGSVSFALAAAGLLNEPLDSTAFEHWGKPGPGRWITIYANAGHAWMTVAGMRFDTSGHGPGGSRWTGASRGTGGFVVRHPVGL